jgi:hypothetical protein
MSLFSARYVQVAQVNRRSCPLPNSAQPLTKKSRHNDPEPPELAPRFLRPRPDRTGQGPIGMGMPFATGKVPRNGPHHQAAGGKGKAKGGKGLDRNDRRKALRSIRREREKSLLQPAQPHALRASPKAGPEKKELEAIKKGQERQPSISAKRHRDDHEGEDGRSSHSNASSSNGARSRKNSPAPCQNSRKRTKQRSHGGDAYSDSRSPSRSRSSDRSHSSRASRPPAGQRITGADIAEDISTLRTEIQTFRTTAEKTFEVWSNKLVRISEQVRALRS